MDLLRSLCSVPTAPFAEQLVVEFVRDFVLEHRGLRLSEDEWGNLLIECGGTDRKTKGSRLVFAAHMDHPGFVAGRMIAYNWFDCDKQPQPRIVNVLAGCVVPAPGAPR